MHANSPEQIDWDGIWDQQWKLSAKPEGVEYWDEVATNYDEFSGSNNYIAALLGRIRLPKGSSVLDIGCGTGTLTLPLAQRARQVTALDWSPTMLEVLSRAAAANNLDNLAVVNQDWCQAKPDYAVEPHDVVIASRSLPMGNPRVAMARMDRLAKRACYLTWIASEDQFESAIARIRGKTHHPFPSHTILFNILYSMGIYANVTIFAVRGTRQYSSLDDAVAKSLRGATVDDNERERLRAFCQSTMSYRNGTFRRVYYTRWALIWWQKDRHAPIVWPIEQ